MTGQEVLMVWFVYGVPLSIALAFIWLAMTDRRW